MADHILNDMPQFYIYIHSRVSDGRVFYVGKGTGRRAYNRSDRSDYWKNIVNKHGLKIEIVARMTSEIDAFEHEKELIRFYRTQGHPLCNLTDGGDGSSGYSHTEQSREKISLTNTGKKRTPEQNKRNSDARIGKPLKEGVGAKISASNKGRVVSAETRAKISSSHVGMKPSKEACEKISRANKGRIRSPEFKAKIVAARTGKVCSSATRAKIAESNRGKVVSMESRDKISASLSGRKLSAETLEKLIAIARNPERRAQHSAVMKGRPWSDARRAAQKNMLKE